MNKKLLATLTFVIFLSFIFVTQAVEQLVIPQTGKIVTPPSISANPSSINWGNVTIGESYTETCEISNSGTSPALLNMTYDNITLGVLTWDFENQTLPASSTVLVNFTLTINLTAPQGDFAFNIYINVVG